MFRIRANVGTLAFLCVLFCVLSMPASSAIAQTPSTQAGEPGTRMPTTAGIALTSAQVMQLQAATPARVGMRPEHELEGPERDDLKANPDALPVSHYPLGGPAPQRGPRSIHTPSTTFDGATLTDTGAFPPDSMGTVGPAQYVVAVNGRIRSFTKAGVADGVLNLDPDVFFASVMTPVSGSVVLNFTSDPQVRYDRFSGRWFLSIIDVPCTNATCTTTAANRWLLAVSDAASAGTISASTVWTFYFVQADPGTNFCDYPSLGIDVNALYFGCNMFSSVGAFVGTNGYVVQKSSSLSGGPLVVTSFPNIGTTTAGPYAPRGADNFDPTATEGYFVGVDTGVFSRVVLRRISNPGSATPTISANINVTVPTTGATNPVEHAGNTGGTNGRLDSLDDRLFAAMIRGGHLWTAHNLRVSPAGVANTGTTARKASRWYDFQNLTTTPTLNQSGTVYDSAATLAAALQYWIPSITATGQGHAVLGFSVAGTPSGATPGFVGRLAGDPLGTMTGPPTSSSVFYGVTSTNYNPPSDPGGASGRRWGDYSFTVVDPLDDMTVWTIQEYNQALNSYAVRIGKLLAPPPATPTCSASPIAFAGGTGNVTINATSSGGSGFYDPGTNLPAPALAFKHLAATMTNGTVNSVTYNSPTQATLNITANVPGLQNVTLTNPDGQLVTATGCINVSGVVTHTVTPSVSGGNGTITPSTPQTVNDGATTAFTLTPAANYHIVTPVGGTCGGTLVGNTYTTNAVTADCTVIASFAIDTHTVTPSVSGGNGTITPSTPQSVNHGSTTAFTLTPAANYHVVTPVGGTCGGTLVGNTYTTNAVTADCTVVASFAIDTHTVTPSVSGGNGTITPSTPQSVNHGSTTAFTLTPAANYHVVTPVGGTCGGTLVGNTYTTNAVTADCTVIASFAIDTHTVTPSVSGGNGTITPSTPQTVNHGSTTAFTLAPNANYHIGTVTGSCGGSLVGNTYTTNAVNADCTVIASFAIDTHTVTPSVSGGNGTITPSTPQTVNHGSTTAFTLTPSANFHVANVAGTCGGNLVGNTYTTNAVNADCSVIASFAIDTHTVTPSVSGGNGTITPSTPQTVNHGSTTAFTLAPNANYHIGTVTGSCGGSLVGNTYTTNAVNADCTVIASFAVDIHAPTLAKAFAPTSVTITVPSTVTLTLANTNATVATLTAALVDTLPAGLVVASPTNAATTCPSGTVTAVVAAGSFSLASGAQIPGNGSCTVTVNVVAASSGSYTNTLAAGALQTDAGSNAAAASAVLGVTPIVITDRIFCDGFDGVACSNTIGSMPGWIGTLLPGVATDTATFADRPR
jgi:hypothetical protein